MKNFFTPLLVLCLVCLMMLSGCDTKIKDYTGTPLLNLTFEMVDYNGGYTKTYVFDFEANVVKSRGYLPYENEEPEFSIIATFSDEEESILINKLYSYGLFDIEEYYKSPEGIIDGGGWDLTIEYSDGTTKISRGSNNSPKNVFSNCAKAFYDICGDGIVAYVPKEYYCPPNVSYTFRNESNINEYSSYGKRVDYEWNGFESIGNSIYDANEAADFNQKFYNGEEYTLILYTSNYRSYDKFHKCIVTSYDYNENLTNETIVYNSGWFKQTEIRLQLNKIYLIRFEFINGDFVEYTFNTNVTSND